MRIARAKYIGKCIAPKAFNDIEKNKNAIEY